jgi:hypothetical protein
MLRQYLIIESLLQLKRTLATHPNYKTKRLFHVSSVCSSIIASSEEISFLTLNVDYETAKNILLDVLQHLVDNVGTTEGNGNVYSKLEQLRTYVY